MHKADSHSDTTKKALRAIGHVAAVLGCAAWLLAPATVSAQPMSELLKHKAGKAAKPKAKKKAKAADTTEEVPETLTREILAGVLDEARSAFTSCVQRHLPRGYDSHFSVSGGLVVDGHTGAVTQSKDVGLRGLSLNKAELSCVKGVVAGLKFPPFKRPDARMSFSHQYKVSWKTEKAKAPEAPAKAEAPAEAPPPKPQPKPFQPVKSGADL